MSMMNENALMVAFRTKLDTLSGIPDATQRAYENDEFEPTVDKEWMRETLLVGDEAKTSTGLNESSGEVRYDCFAPVGAGTESIRDVARVIADGFEAGQSLQNGGLHVSIEQTKRLPGREDFGNDEKTLWYMIPVVISWRVFTLTTV